MTHKRPRGTGHTRGGSLGRPAGGTGYIGSRGLCGRVRLTEWGLAGTKSLEGLARCRTVVLLGEFATGDGSSFDFN